MMENVIKILLLLSSVIFVRAVIKPSSTLYIAQGEGFAAYLAVPESFSTIQNCWFRVNSEEKIRLELNTTIPIVTDRGELVLPFSEQVCGIRVSKTNFSDVSVWTLEAENIYGDFEQGTLTVELIPDQANNFETFLTKDIGSGTITCSKNQYTKHCKIIEDNGNSWDQCELYTVIKPNRTFDCLIFNWGQLSPSHEHIVVNIKDTSINANATVEETQRSFILRCTFDHNIFSCLSEMPNRRNEFYIMEGLYNGKYSSYDTSTSKSLCAFEIPKPLAPNEVGLWRIKNFDSGTMSGCLFYIGKDKSEIIESELEKLIKPKTVEVYESDQNEATLPEVSFWLPFVIDDCYIKAPNNSVYFPEPIKFQRQRLYGNCSFTNLPSIAGTWTCGTRSRAYHKEIIRDIQVSIKPKTGEVLTNSLKIRKGRDAELMCRSSFQDPINNCLFINPTGQVHLVGSSNSIKTGGHVQYHGQGLHMGDCGVKINDVTDDDFGEWICQFSVLSNRQPSLFKIKLSESGSSHATSIGLGVGITTIVILIGGVILGSFFYKNRQKSAQHTFPTADQPSTIYNAHMGTINLEAT